MFAPSRSPSRGVLAKQVEVRASHRSRICPGHERWLHLVCAFVKEDVRRILRGEARSASTPVGRKQSQSRVTVPYADKASLRGDVTLRAYALLASQFDEVIRRHPTVTAPQCEITSHMLGSDRGLVDPEPHGVV